MNQRACILALTVGTLCTASMSSYALFPTDGDASPVNGTPKTFHWGDLVTSGAGNLSFIGNRLSYTTAGATTTDSANPDFATLNWTSYAPGSASWTFELDASMPDLSSKLNDGQFVQFGLQALGTPSNFSLYLEEFMDGPNLVRQFVRFVSGGVPQPSVLLPTDTDKLRFVFDGTTLSAEFDVNANDADTWVPFGQLAGFDLSTISVFGESGFLPNGASRTGPTITASDGVGATVVPEPSANAIMLAGLAALGWLGLRARRGARPGLA